MKSIKVISATSVEQVHSVVWPVSESEGWNLATHSPTLIYQVAGEGMLIAVDTDQPAKGLASLECTIYNNQVGFIGCFIAISEARGKGIGAATFQAGLEFYKSKGVMSIGLDAVPAQQKRYESHGFVQTAGVQHHQRRPKNEMPAAPETTSLPSSVQLVDIKDIPVAELIEQDLQYTGYDRTKMWKDTILLKDPTTQGLAVLNSEKKLLAWILWRSNTKGLKVSPLYSSDEAFAGILLDELIDRAPDDATFFLDAWSMNPKAAELATSRGFKHIVTFAHMWRGPAPKEQDEGQIGQKTVYFLLDAAHG